MSAMTPVQIQTLRAIIADYWRGGGVTSPQAAQVILGIQQWLESEAPPAAAVEGVPLARSAPD